MKMIWATWRKNYIQNHAVPSDECVFCHIANNPSQDTENLVLYRGKHNFVIMNLYPYTSGHILIVPYQHTDNLSNLSDEESLEMNRLEKRCINWQKKAFQPHGFNIGMNLGNIAGAGIEDHIHMHIVPRWKGDSNFMPVVGETRVMSVSLQDAYTQLLQSISEESNE